MTEEQLSEFLADPEQLERLDLDEEDFDFLYERRRRLSIELV